MIMAGGACTYIVRLFADAATCSPCPPLLPVERQAWFGLHRRAARTSAGGLGGVPGGARVSRATALRGTR